MYDYSRYPAPSGYFTAADGVKLPFFIYGKTDAEHTILFLNGFTCNQFNIAKVIEHLSGDFRIATFDYRGQGLAYRDKYPKVSVEAALDDIDAFHAHLGRPKVLLFGYSMGCQLAVDWNFQRSEYVLGMVLLLGIYGNIFNTFLNLGIFAPLVQVTHELFPFFRRSYRLLWRAAHSLPYPVRVALGRGALLNPDLVSEHELRPFLDQLAELDFEYIIRMSHAIHNHSNEGQYHKIESPLLVISGESDLFALPIHSERVHQAVQGSWYFAIPSGTHNAILENAGDIHNWVREFLTEKKFI